MSRLVLVRTIVAKSVILLKRYAFNTVSQLAGLYMMFVVLFFGGRALAGAAFDDTLAGLIVGFFLFTMAIVAFSGLSWDLMREAQWGTLEQLFMTPYGFEWVMVVKTSVNVLLSLLWGSIMLALMMATTGRFLHVDVLTVVPVALLTLASAVGIGFVFGGLALVYKRIESVFQLFQFGFIGLIGAPVGRYPFLEALPISLGSHLLRRTMGEGVRLWELPPGDLAVLVANAAVYFAVGLLVFRFASRKARRDGVLGHY